LTFINLLKDYFSVPQEIESYL